MQRVGRSESRKQHRAQSRKVPCLPKGIGEKAEEVELINEAKLAMPGKTLLSPEQANRKGKRLAEELSAEGF